jgi:probable F420-dependent oxidoreductase
MRLRTEAGMNLGGYGIWQATARATPGMAAEAEKLGYGAFWIGGSPAGRLTEAEEILDATERITVATGIVNIWAVPAVEAAASYHRLEARHPGRFVLGVGIGHPEHTTQFSDPFETTVHYLDALAAEGVPGDRAILAALGPKVMKLAGDRTGGAHPYLTTPTHTAQARRILPPGAVLAPEQKVLPVTDPVEARAAARAKVGFYLSLDNYRRNLIRCGFAEADLADGGSDALIDALVLYGTADTIAAGLRAHRDAGADHVCIQVLGEDLSAAHRALADALDLGR